MTITLTGGEGPDTLVGDPANRDEPYVVRGYGGNDVVGGGERTDDTVYGGEGDDRVSGAPGIYFIYDYSDDTLYGGAGRDLVRGGTGNDRLFGGEGDDQFSVMPLSGQYAIVDGGAGRDTFDAEGGVVTFQTPGLARRGTAADGLTDLISIEIIRNASAVYGGGLGPADADFVLVDYAEGSEGRNSIYGGPGNDELYGAGGDDTVNGGDDDDSLFGGEGADYVDGGKGSDEVHGGAGNDRLYGGYGFDEIYGDAGDDRLYAGPSGFILFNKDDGGSLFGGEGEDELRGEHSSRDWLFGGADDDRLHWSRGGPADAEQPGGDVMNGGAGDDVFEGVRLDLADEPAPEIDGGAGFDVLDLPLASLDEGAVVRVTLGAQRLVLERPGEEDVTLDFAGIEDVRDLDHEISYGLRNPQIVFTDGDRRAADLLLGSPEAPPWAPPGSFPRDAHHKGPFITDDPWRIWGYLDKANQHDVVTFHTTAKLGGELDVVIHRTQGPALSGRPMDVRHLSFELGAGQDYLGHLVTLKPPKLDGVPQWYNVTFTFAPERTPLLSDVEDLLDDTKLSLLQLGVVDLEGFGLELFEKINAALEAGDDVVAFLGTWAARFGAAAKVFDVAGRLQNIGSALNQGGAALGAKQAAVEITDFIAGMVATGAAGLAGGATLGPVGAVGGGFLAGLVYTNGYSASVRKMVEDKINGETSGGGGASAKAFLAAAEDGGAPLFDPEWYAERHPEAVAAVNAGQHSSLLAWFLDRGLKQGHAPSAGAGPIEARDVAMKLKALAPAAEVNLAVRAVAFGDYVGDGRGKLEGQVAALFAEAAAGDRELSVGLFAAANRIARDWVLNRRAEWHEAAQEGGAAGWADVLGDGRAFAEALAGAAGGFGGLAGAQLFALPAAGKARGVAEAFLEDPDAAAALAGAKAIGVAEVGGLWALLVSDAAPDDGAPGKDDPKFRFTGDDAPDLVFAGARPGIVDGGGGDDLIFGDRRKDKLKGGDGDDQVEGAGGKDKVLGGAGGDLLLGGAGNDRMKGGGGGDEIVGGAGRDKLAGGGGGDRFRFAQGDGKDLLLDWQDGRDRIVFDGGADRFKDLEIRDKGKAALVDYGGKGDLLKLKGVDADELTPGDFLFA
ncbi:calcium-binding protein [Albimonas sp. CAU 1670]|uniref:calcium-binding protein n=1 Tax=Albimonas sp. CAU 1670 TaxID=3032599 RepID=UPI0023DC58D7|nr:calcium-binding protein [Albimonas sp. CAU 1670]MDF2233724.1 calcium-binding protein [Albimonas sp. CAU 1670]